MIALDVRNPSVQAVPQVPDDVSAELRTIYMGFVSFTILVWDHIDTFTAEVEYIWKKQKTPLIYMFLLNRYLTPLGFIVNLFAYLSPVWTPEAGSCSDCLVQILTLPSSCTRFIRYEGAMTMIGINIVATMMYMRIYVLYQSKRPILVGVGLILIFQVIMNAWLLTHGEAVVHNSASGSNSCTMIFDPSISAVASSSAWLPLLYDTIVFILIAYRIIPSRRDPYQGYTTRVIMTRLLEDGLIYYTVICTITLVLTLMIVFAKPGSKNITAQLELLLTVAMMSRITLNLKKSVANLDLANPDTLTIQLGPSIAHTRDRSSVRISMTMPRPPTLQEMSRSYTPSSGATREVARKSIEFGRRETLQLRPSPV